MAMEALRALLSTLRPLHNPLPTYPLVCVLFSLLPPCSSSITDSAFAFLCLCLSI
jgi:hypothetical protein